MSGNRLTCLRGGRVHDPVHGVDGEVRDLWLRGGRLVEPAPDEPADTTIDLSGCIVMAGGIDLHTHSNVSDGTDTPADQSFDLVSSRSLPPSLLNCASLSFFSCW